MPSRRLSRHRGPVYLAITVSGSASHAPFLRCTTPVMWYRRDIRDACDFEPRVVQRAHRRLSSWPWSLHHHFQILQAILRRCLAGFRSRDLSCERSTLARSLESARPCSRPCERVALPIGDCDHSVVERRMYMGNPVADRATDLLLRSCFRLCHRGVLGSIALWVCADPSWCGRWCGCAGLVQAIHGDAECPGNTRDPSIV